MESMFNVTFITNAEFKKIEDKKYFETIQSHLTEEQHIRLQIEKIKRNPHALAEWAKREKIKNRNAELKRLGLHPIIVR